MAIPLGPGDKALTYALGGVMRGGVGRAGAVDGRAYVAIDGDQIGWARDDHNGTLLGTLRISDLLEERPNSCTFRVNGYVPADYAEIIITQGSKNRIERLFAGYATTVQQVYAGIPANVQADVQAVDYTWLLALRKVTGQYRNQSATAIVIDLVARAAAVNGVTTTNVAAGLPVLDVITFTNEELPDAITRICRRIGADWYIDYHKDVHVFFEEALGGAPGDLVPSHKTLADVRRLHEGTQGLTRVLVEGRGSRLLAGVAAGETLLPMEAIDSFAPAADVFLKVTFHGAEEGTLHLTFSGANASAGGSLVGPGATPSSAPTLSVSSGGAVDAGQHDYAYTWLTAAGETKAGPVASVTPSVMAAPATMPALAYFDSPVDPTTSYAWHIGDTVEFAYSYGATNSPADQSPLSPGRAAVAIASSYHWSGTAPGSNAQGFFVAMTPSADPNVKYIMAWHRINGGPWFVWLAPTIGNGGQNPAPQAYLTQPTNYSQPWTPATVAPSLRTVNVAGIAVGPASVTARKLYRTKVGLSTLQLVTTLPNNTATDYVDAAADTTLGAQPPAGDTSGLAQPSGVINPGAAAVIVASTAPFRAAGGWAATAEQGIRYTGIAGGALVGVPASGPGAVVGPIQYNTAIRSAPMLTGIPAGALPIPLAAGDEVYLVVQVDDIARQAQLAASLHVADGVREEWIQDRRLSIAEARARGQATLLSRPLVETTIEYRSRDLRTKSGKTITVNLPAPTNISGVFKIQQVVWSNFRPRANQQPTATVIASSRRFSFEDLLRKVRTKE